MKTELLGTTKPCTTTRKYAKNVNISSKDSLNHLKKRVELQHDQAKTYVEHCQGKIEMNQEIIRKLRAETLEARVSSKRATTNECLMRQALRDHHTGSSVFREREPRDVDETIDNKVSDLQNKLNKLRHIRRARSKHLQSLLDVLNETVNDVVFLELEGPMGDTRCSGIENHICAKDNKYIEAEMIGHTYRHIRDQLALESLTSQTALDAVNRLLRCLESELSMCKQSEVEAMRGKQEVDAEVFKTEFDLYSIVKERKAEVVDLKKKSDEEKHELTALWRSIQAHFAAQESMPLPHMNYHSRDSISVSKDRHEEKNVGHDEEDLELMLNVTGSHSIPEVAEKFEKQESTYQHSKALVNELEVRKVALLQKLEDLNTVRYSLIHKAESEEDTVLRTASGDCQAAQAAASATRWSRVAASNRVTQALSRLRQLLEYMVDAFRSAGLIPPPAAHDATDTALHLHTLMAAAGDGAAALMACLRDAEPGQAQRATAVAAFLMTRSEQRLQKRRAELERDPTGDDIGFVGTDDDTTGDDAVLSRTAIKRQAQIILLARQKPGARRKKT